MRRHAGDDKVARMKPLLRRPSEALLVLAGATAFFCGAALVGVPIDPARAQVFSRKSEGTDRMVQIEATDNGGEKTIRVGDSFELRLPENPSTGYRWLIHEPVGPVVEVEDNSFVLSAPGLPGAGGLRSWRFRAMQTGRALLTLENRRSWEPAPIGAFAVTIDVTAQ
jgi:inhibitor of cysteine peptidase